MNVMSYNIQHGEGLDQKLSLSRIARHILKSDARIVAVQEVDKHYGERSEFKNQAKQLSELLQFNFVFGANLKLPSKNNDSKKREYGTAIYSYFPIIESENIYLSSFGQEQRGILRAKINVKGTYMNVYNTHLALDKSERKTQILEILELISKDNRPHILMGDFNAEPLSEEMLLLKSEGGLQDVFELKTNAYTHSSLDPTVRIDYIFVSSHIKYHTSKVLQVDGSDHLPIVTNVNL